MKCSMSVGKQKSWFKVQGSGYRVQGSVSGVLNAFRALCKSTSALFSDIVECMDLCRLFIIQYETTFFSMLIIG